MFLELCFLAFFLLGFGLLRLDKLSRRRGQKSSLPSSPFALKMKVIRSEHHAGNSSAVVDAWRKLAEANFRECCTLDVLRVVMQSALEQEDYVALVGEIGRYLASFPRACRRDWPVPGFVPGPIRGDEPLLRRADEEEVP